MPRKTTKKATQPNGKTQPKRATKGRGKGKPEEAPESKPSGEQLPLSATLRVETAVSIVVDDEIKKLNANIGKHAKFMRDAKGRIVLRLTCDWQKVFVQVRLPKKHPVLCDSRFTRDSSLHAVSSGAPYHEDGSGSIRPRLFFWDNPGPSKMTFRKETK